jgi:hypothetical protein
MVLPRESRSQSSLQFLGEIRSPLTLPVGGHFGAEFRRSLTTSVCGGSFCDRRRRWFAALCSGGNPCARFRRPLPSSVECRDTRYGLRERVIALASGRGIIAERSKRDVQRNHFCFKPPRLVPTQTSCDSLYNKFIGTVFPDCAVKKFVVPVFRVGCDYQMLLPSPGLPAFGEAKIQLPVHRVSYLVDGPYRLSYRIISHVDRSLIAPVRSAGPLAADRRFARLYHNAPTALPQASQPCF